MKTLTHVLQIESLGCSYDNIEPAHSQTQHVPTSHLHLTLPYLILPYLILPHLWWNQAKSCLVHAVSNCGLVQYYRNWITLIQSEVHVW